MYFRRNLTKKIEELKPEIELCQGHLTEAKDAAKEIGAKLQESKKQNDAMQRYAPPLRSPLVFMAIMAMTCI